MDLKQLYTKYKDVIPYLFFGVCTTLVNVAVYWIASYLLNLDVMLSTIVAWFFAVLFAYITNRKWVFHSQTKRVQAIIKEVVSFFVCRLSTGIFDWLCMYAFVEILGFNDIIIKIISNILVIILNYVASKMVIFREEKND